MRKKFRSLLALVMALAMILALTACGSSSTAETDDEDTSIDYEAVANYIEVEAGDVLYSDDNCSVTLVSLETENGGSTMRLTVASSYECSLEVDVGAYDTEEYTTFLENYAADKSASVVTKETNGDFTGEGESEIETYLYFFDEYVYFDITIFTYSEFITQEQYGLEETDDLIDAELYSGTILVNAAE